MGATLRSIHIVGDIRGWQSCVAEHFSRQRLAATVARPSGSSAAPRRRCARRFLWLLVICTAAFSGSGCTPWREYVRNGFKVGPNFQKPAAPVASQWIDAADGRVRSQTEDISRWWTVFNDPVLNGLIENAYRQNLTLREAGFRVLQARALFGIARGSFFPQTQTMNGDTFKEAISKNSANRAFVGTRFFDQSDYGFNLAWEIDFWGRFRRSIESANESLNVTIEHYDEVLVTLLGDVATAYVQIRTIEREIEYTQTNVGLQRETLDLAEARFKGGTTSDLDVEQAKSVLAATTEAQIPSAANQFATGEQPTLCAARHAARDLESTRLGQADIPERAA